MKRFWEKVEKTDECWNWTASKKRDGYGQFRINGKIVAAHRVSYAAENGPIPDGMFVCHACDNPACVNPAHLFLGTDQDNKNDMYRKRRHVFGEKHPLRKLTTDVVLKIRQDAKSGMSQRNIARKYNTQRSQVSLIANGKRWSSVGDAA